MLNFSSRDNPLSHLTAYDIRHLVFHLAEAGLVEALHRLLSLESAGRRNAWFHDKFQRNELSGYLADLEIARKLAESPLPRLTEKRCVSVGLQCRYALIAAVIRDLAQYHGPQSTARYLQAGMWTMDHALQWAKLNPDKQAGLLLAEAMLRLAHPDQLDEIAHLALSIGLEIPDGDNRILGLVALAGNVPVPLLRRLLELVGQEQNEGTRLGGLRRLVEKLSGDLRYDALEIAQQFQDLGMKAEAIAVVAATLDEPDRMAAFRKSIGVVQEANSQGHSVRRLSTLGAGFTSLIPTQLLIELLESMDEQPPDDARPKVLLELLSRWADEDADSVEKCLDEFPSWMHDDVRARTAVAFCRGRRYKEAIATTAEIMEGGGTHKTETIVFLLERVPDSELDSLFHLFREIPPSRAIPALRRLANSVPRLAPRLLELANHFTYKDDQLKAQAAIAPALSPGELDQTLSLCLTAGSISTQSRVLADLAPYLDITKVRSALDVVGKPDTSEVGALALLRRLVTLGEPADALRRIGRFGGMSEFTRAKILDGVAIDVPDEFLPVILAMTFPTNVAAERARARIALLRWLPADAVADIVHEVGELVDPHDRVNVLSEMLSLSPAEAIGDLDCHFSTIGTMLIEALDEVLQASTHGQNEVMRQGFSSLSRLLDLSPSIELTNRVMALARNEKLQAEEQIALLVELASVGGDAEHVQMALAAAVHMATADPRLVDIIVEGLPADHMRDLGQAVVNQTTTEDLRVFICAVAHLLDSAALDEAVRRVMASADFELRLGCLYFLLPHLDISKHSRVIEAELTRAAEWPHFPEAFVHALSVLAPYQPGIVVPYLQRLHADFNKLPPRSQVVYARHLAAVSTLTQEVVARALVAAGKLPTDEKPDAFAYLASYLAPEQIDQALHLLSGCPQETLDSALTHLIHRAAVLDDAPRISDCLRIAKRPYSSNGLLEKTVDVLPLSTLSIIYGSLLGDRFGEQVSMVHLGALAVRAAELGDMFLTLAFLDKKGNSTYSGDCTLELVYLLAPESWSDMLIERANQFTPWNRASTLLNLLYRLPQSQRKPLVEAIVESSTAVPHVKLSRLPEVIYRLEPELRQLPQSEVLTMWRDVLRRNSQHGRKAVLLAIQAFTPTLVAHFGPEIAVHLDEAIRIGGCDTWP